MFPNVKPVLFCDNESVVNKLRSGDEIHPFVSDYADFCRQTMEQFSIEVKWCPSLQNLADKLTKPTKW